MPSQTSAEPAQSFSQPPPIFTKSGLVPSECLPLDPCASGNTPRSSFSETTTQRRCCRLPTGLLISEISFQYKRCQRTTVSGVTARRDCCHADQNRRMATQKSLSKGLVLAAGADV